MMDKRKGRTLVRNRAGVKVRSEITSLDDLHRIFVDYKTSQGLRPRTISEHKIHYGYFKGWIEGQYPSITAQEIHQQHIQEYVSFMSSGLVKFDGHPYRPQEDVGLSPMTINIRLRTLKCFMKYLYEQEYINGNPVADIKLFKTDEDHVGAFTEKQIEKLLKAPDRKTYAGFRDYVAMLILVDTGLRVSELLSLTPEMFDSSARMLTLSGKITKNRKKRQVPISPETVKVLKQLIQENMHLFYHEVPEEIFVTAFGDPLSITILSRRIKKYAEKSKISGVRVSPHTFRHTFSKFYILNGGDPYGLQRLLGHSTMDTTRKYIQLYSEDMKNQHNKYSPLKRIKR
jgi:integrase/recombinase XerD